MHNLRISPLNHLTCPLGIECWVFDTLCFPETSALPALKGQESGYPMSKGTNWKCLVTILLNCECAPEVADSMKQLLEGVKVHKPGLLESTLYAMVTQIRGDWKFQKVTCYLLIVIFYVLIHDHWFLFRLNVFDSPNSLTMHMCNIWTLVGIWLTRIQGMVESRRGVSMQPSVSSMQNAQEGHDGCAMWTSAELQAWHCYLPWRVYQVRPEKFLEFGKYFLYWFKHAISGSEIWKHVVEPLDKNPRPSLWTSTLLSADGEVVLYALCQSRNMPLGYWFSLADFSWWLWCLGPHGEWQCQCSTGTCLWPLQTMDEGKQNPAPEFWLMIVYNINIL